jgi:hypothetical protein
MYCLRSLCAGWQRSRGDGRRLHEQRKRHRSLGYGEWDAYNPSSSGFGTGLGDYSKCGTNLTRRNPRAFNKIPVGMPQAADGQNVKCSCDSGSYPTDACKIGTDLGYPWTFQGPDHPNNANYLSFCSGRLSGGNNILGGWFTSGTDQYNDICLNHSPYTTQYTCNSSFNN